MEVNQLQRSFLEYIAALFREGFLDGQFSQLQLLQDESNPDFVVEVVSLFFEDSERLLNDLTKAFIGAQRVENACITFRNYCDERNIEACLRCLPEVKQEYLLAKTKLEALFRLEQQIVTAGGAIPILDEFS